MTIEISTVIDVKDVNDLDDISIQVSNSVTGFQLTELTILQISNDRIHTAEVRGILLHLEGFETIEELERFME